MTDVTKGLDQDPGRREPGDRVTMLTVATVTEPPPNAQTMRQLRETVVAEALRGRREVRKDP